MGTDALKRGSRGLLPMLLLFVLLLGSLTLMSDATHNSQRFGQLYSWLLLVNAAGVVVLAALIGINLFWLVMQYRSRAAGARLTARLVLIFVGLAVVPVSIVYLFSVQFLDRGIDSWFDVRIGQSLEDALQLSRSAFEVRLRTILHQTQNLAEELTDVPSAVAPMSLFDLRVRSGALELTLFGDNGRIIASSSLESTAIVPERPSEGILGQLRKGQPYVALDPGAGGSLRIRAVVPVPSGGPGTESRILQALFDVPERLGARAARVQAAYARYKELAYLRTPLKRSYVLTLSLVLLLSLLSAVWAAFYSARRLVAPVKDLAEGTRAVAEGDYSRRLPAAGHDEIGFLVQSFNAMTERLAQARDQARRGQAQIERQRAYLQTLLGSLSSGVLSLSPRLEIRTVNEAATEILGVSFAEDRRQSLADWVAAFPFLAPLQQAIERHRGEGQRWSEEVALFGVNGRQVLICRGVALPLETDGRGMVIVFDDVTALIQAQRDAAWGEVARRLAHEIKNPLTPIQLSAERLRRKYLHRLPAEDAAVLDRATRTIVNQVEAMKEMVNAFSEYARAPQVQLVRLDLNRLVAEILELYAGDKGVRVERRLDPTAPVIEADPGRFRQLLHNLLKNAREAVAGREDARIRVETLVVAGTAGRFVELRVADNGSGFSDEVMDRLFEPYVTTKPRGTGLGLPIVKKIVEEHGGAIQVVRPEAGGAEVRIRLPLVETVQGGRSLDSGGGA